MSKQSKSGWDENGIYREYGEDGTLLLERTSFGSVNPTCKVGKAMIGGMGCVTFVPPSPGAHPSGINGGLGASLLGVCDDGKATISSNDLLNVLKAIVAVDPIFRYYCCHCKSPATWDSPDTYHVVHRIDCPWLLAKNYLTGHA